ncbi:TolB protein [Granulibacter bethesdensis]|nr:TolB protein [Granulibacter bethesdensis]AHJ66496.1 TolB protein [Granulibacter bethesdensis CGDNIH4]APH54387.1 TolB protein [Granulibacter bethesdensis]APH59456.1 TolB protein [Granulibacter bethesdensis]APH61972.1 TolB protein [Granulibacter bethesdensis]
MPAEQGKILPGGIAMTHEDRIPDRIAEQLMGLRRRDMLGFSAAALAAPLGFAGPAMAQQAAGQSAVIDVDRARTAPIPIAIPSFGGGSQLAQDMAGVIAADLERSGLFRIVAPGAYPQQSGDVPNFQSWGAIGAQALVTGNVSGSGGSVRVEFRLWDVLPQQQIQGTAYTTTSGNWRRISHIIADVIYERMLGEKGYFDTRIVYVSNTGPRTNRTKRLAVMDQDSANNRYLTDGSWMVLTPRFHPTRDEIVFMSYANNRPRVYTFNLATGGQRMLGEWPGMTFAPRFSPDGSSVVMSMTRGGGSDIYVVGLGGGGHRQLTNSGSIDTSPCFSPDGSQIVFNSDRGGDQQLYVMGADGSGVRRISFGSGRYATPVWSPRGDLIAFTRLGSSAWNIGVMKPDGSGERILAQGYDVEGPTFCPNGRVLMFWSASGGRQKLVSVDITGFNERPVPTPTDASDPAWSPLAG